MHTSFLLRLRSERRSLLRDPEVAKYINDEEILNSAATTLPQIFPNAQFLDDEFFADVRAKTVRNMEALFGTLGSILAGEALDMLFPPGKK